jgi:hypothetical protein
MRAGRAGIRTAIAAALAATAPLVLGGCDGTGPVAAPSFECFRIADPYAQPGSWYRGNFHMHSEHSDGALDGPHLLDLYHRNGYAVLCISDHNQYGNQDGGVLPQYQSDDQVHDWNQDGRLHPERVFGSGVEAYVRAWDQPPATWVRDGWYRTELSKWDDVPVVLAGAEMSLRGFHIGLVGTPAGALEPPDGSDAYIERTHNAGGFVSLAHPGEWNLRPGDLAHVLNLRRFDAIEIMNGVRLTHERSGGTAALPAAPGRPGATDLCAGAGPADATPLWDGLLSRGFRLWGIANDDCHTWEGAPEGYPFSAFDMVLAAEPTAEGYLTALQAGSFYGSTGLFFRDLGARGDSVVAWVPGAKTIRFIGWGGRVLLQADDERAAYGCSGSEGYVRVEATGGTDPSQGWAAQVWSQPFYIESAPCSAPRTGEPEGN